MAFRDYRPLTQRITIPNTDIEATIRPLNESDVSWLFARHENDLEYIIEQILTPEGGFDAARLQADLPALIRSVLATAPALMTDIIACAGDEEDAAEAIATIPLTAKAEIIGAVLRLTLEAEGGLEKLLGLVAAVARGPETMTKALGTAPAPMNRAERRKSAALVRRG